MGWKDRKMIMKNHVSNEQLMCDLDFLSKTTATVQKLLLYLKFK